MGIGDHLITFDTIVYKNGMVLGKPRDKEEARRYLKILSGDLHHVYTGIVVGLKNEYIFDYEVTRVYFDELDDELIEWYLTTEEYKHAAGGYSVQGHTAPFIKYIEGCYYNIVGLPLNKLFKMMRKFGIKLIDYIKVNR